MAENVTITIEDGDDVTINVAEAQDGAAATIAVGTTTTGNAGTNASVTNSGTTSAAVLNFTIPRGATGANGANGATGPAGPNSITNGSTATNINGIMIGNGQYVYQAQYGVDVLAPTSDGSQLTGLTSSQIDDATNDGATNPEKLLKTDEDGALIVAILTVQGAIYGNGNISLYNGAFSSNFIAPSSGSWSYQSPLANGTLALTSNANGQPDKLTDGTIGGNLTINSTSYTYGTGAAAAHRTALESPSTSEVMPYPSIGASVRFAFFDDFMNVTGSPWASTGTGTTTSTAPSLTAGARHIGCVSLTTGSASNNQRGYFLSGESGQSLIGTTYHALFAITDPTNCAIYIGSGGGSDAWGLACNSSTNSGQWVINQNGTITTFTAATPQAGNMGSSGKRYRLALTKTSATQVYVRLEIADWNSGTWTVVHNGSVTVNSYSGGYSAANCWFHVTTLTTATRSLIMDYFGISHTIVR